MIIPPQGLATGTIKILSTDRTYGSIESDSGAAIPFRMTAVLAYDAPTLAVGKIVDFDLTTGKNPIAVNVSVCRSTARLPVVRREEALSLRYVGFEQNAASRIFHFENRGLGPERGIFNVTVELALLRKHKVPIQDGPALCLDRLGLQLQTRGTPNRLDYQLTDADMLAYSASRPVPAKRRPMRTHAAKA